MTMQPSMEERARGIEIRECIGIVAYIVPSSAAANKPALFLGIMRLGSLNLLHYNIFVSLMSPPSFFFLFFKFNWKQRKTHATTDWLNYKEEEEGDWHLEETVGMYPTGTPIIPKLCLYRYFYIVSYIKIVYSQESIRIIQQSMERTRWTQEVFPDRKKTTI